MRGSAPSAASRSPSPVARGRSGRSLLPCEAGEGDRAVRRETEGALWRDAALMGELMAYRSLREFLETLERAGELVRVKEPVSTVLEMTEIQRRLLAVGGPAVL